MINHDQALTNQTFLSSYHQKKELNMTATSKYKKPDLQKTIEVPKYSQTVLQPSGDLSPSSLGKMEAQYSSP